MKKNKERKEDILIHKDLHLLSLFVLFSFIVLLISLDTVPQVLSNSYNKIKDNFLSNNIDQNFLEKSISKIKEKEELKDFSSINDINIEGKSFVIYDVNNQKILAAKNENQILPLASLTKVVTAITAIKLANRNTDIVIEKKLMRVDESYDRGLQENQKWKLSELLKYGLTISSNASMDIIASTVAKSNQDFVNQMNEYVKKLGFDNFNFNSASGLDYGDTIGGKGTALEYAKLFAKVYTLIPDIISYTTNSNINVNSDIGKIYQIPNTNKQASETIGLLASKTGFTDAAGGNLAIMFNEGVNKQIVIVVLGSSTNGRFDDINKLYINTKKILESR